MIELLSLYTGAIITGLLSAAALSLLGCHLASRDQSLQSLVVSQAATVGVLMGAVLLIGFRSHSHGASDTTASTVPLLTGLAIAALFYTLGEKLVHNKRASKTSVHLTLFTLLLATSYWLISFFPALESHMSQAFFGDIVTLSGPMLMFTSAVSTLALASLIVWWRSMANHSFVISVLGGEQIDNLPALFCFRLLTLLLISTCIYSMGLLFTIAYLFLPTVIFSYLKVPSIRLHLLMVTFTATVSFAAGFALSLYFDRISTVPTIVLTTGIYGLLLLYIANTLLPSQRVADR